MKKLLFFSRKIGFIRDAMLKIALFSHWGIHLICCMSNCIRSDKKSYIFLIVLLSFEPSSCPAMDQNVTDRRTNRSINEASYTGGGQLRTN